jgi:hypothetical protein
MRVVRTVAGMLLLAIGLPVLLAGGALWTAKEHRDSEGAYSASFEPVSTAGNAVVVADLDALLADDAPFTRGADTRLRITATTDGGPAFIGIASIEDTATFLAGSPYSRVDGLSLARGPLPMRTSEIAGTGAPGGAPGTQAIWVRQGAGSLEWTPSDLRGQKLSLVVMHLDAHAGLAVNLRAAAGVGWLVPTAYGLLVLGSLMVLLSIAALAWPARPREVVFVVEPDQVPTVSAKLGVTPLSELGAALAPSSPPALWPVPVSPAGAGARPVTLADALASAGVMAPGPAPAWPPFNPPPVSPTLAWPASRPVSPAGPPATWPVPPRDELASRRQALADAASGRRTPGEADVVHPEAAAALRLTGSPKRRPGDAVEADTHTAADSAEATDAAGPVGTAGVADAANGPARAGATGVADAGNRLAHAGAAEVADTAEGPAHAGAAGAADVARTGDASAARTSTAGVADDLARAGTDDKAGAPAGAAHAAAGDQAAEAADGSAADRAGEAASAPAPRAGDDNGKPSLAEALSGWSLGGGRNGAEATEPAAGPARDNGRRSLADLADAARRAARAVVTDGVTTLGMPEEPVQATLAPAKPVGAEPEADAPARPARRRKTAAGLPAPDPAPATAPTSLSLPKRPATRRRSVTTPKQGTAPKPADEPATP